MTKFLYSLMFWISLAMAILATHLDLFITGSIWMLISAVYLVGGDLAAAIRARGK